MNIKNLDYHEDRWVDGNWSEQDLINFEDDIIKHWEGGEIRGPIHLSNGNEKQLIKIFSKIGIEDWVFFNLEVSLSCTFTWNGTISIKTKNP